MFKNWSGEHIEWEYEFLERLLEPLCEVIDTFVKRFDYEKMRLSRDELAPNAVEGDNDEVMEAKKGDVAKLIKKTAVAVVVHLLSAKCEAFKLIAKAVGRRARWFEGCECHKEIWTTKWTSRKRKFEEFAKSVPGQRDCIWKGRRTTDMALGEVNNIVQDIHDATSDRLEEIINRMAGEDSAYLTTAIQELKDAIAEELADKFAYFQELPWLIAGLDGDRIGNRAGAIHVAHRIVANCTALETSGGMARAHRETVLFWTSHADTVRLIARGGLASWQERPKCGIQVKQKALLPCVNRWVEQAHACVKKLMDVAPNMGPAQVSATLRFKEHAEFLLNSSAPRSFITANWFTRIFIAEKFAYSGVWKGMKPSIQLEIIYGFGVQAQFKDFSRQSSAVKKFGATARAIGVAPHTVALGDESRLAIEYARSVLTKGMVFALPVEVCRDSISKVGAISSL